MELGDVSLSHEVFHGERSCVVKHQGWSCCGLQFQGYGFVQPEESVNCVCVCSEAQVLTVTVRHWQCLRLRVKQGYCFQHWSCRTIPCNWTPIFSASYYILLYKMCTFYSVSYFCSSKFMVKTVEVQNWNDSFCFVFLLAFVFVCLWVFCGLVANSVKYWITSTVIWIFYLVSIAGNVHLREFTDFRKSQQKWRRRKKERSSDNFIILLLCLKAVILFLKINYQSCQEKLQNASK